MYYKISYTHKLISLQDGDFPRETSVYTNHPKVFNILPSVQYNAITIRNNEQ
jgi:hypothetical protein